MKEIWRDCWYRDILIPGYKVSNLGRVYSLKTSKIIKPFVSKKGYNIVSLSLGSKGKTQKVSVHRLVAAAFIPIVGDYYTEIDHINTNKLDNRASNLCLTTRSGNHRNPITRHRYSDKMKGSNNPMFGRGMINIPLDFHCKKVKCIETGEVFDSITTAGIEYNISSSNIGRVCNGIRNTAGGYHWAYIKGGD